MSNRDIGVIILSGTLLVIILYSLNLQTSIHYSEIEHGVTFSPPDPEQGTLFTATFYLHNTKQRSVIIKPFTYDFSHYYGDEGSGVVGEAIVYPAIRLEVNETVILQNRTYVPRKSGIFTVESFNRKHTTTIDDSWVPNNLFFSDEYCINKFVNITSSKGYEYWDVAIGDIEYYHEKSDGEYKLILVLSAYTQWSGKNVYWKYAGIINEDLEIQFVRLA